MALRKGRRGQKICQTGLLAMVRSWNFILKEIGSYGCFKQKSGVLAAYLENKLETAKLESAAVVRVSGNGGLERGDDRLKRPGVE